MTTVLHYLPGQTYKPHYDFIDPTVSLFHEELKERGQRCATALIYLSTVFTGGETDFPVLNWRYKGGAGDAIVFWNVSESGQPMPRSLHTGLPPTSGQKWLLSKWVRDRAQPVLQSGVI
jgi:hypothetical protein